MRRQSINRGFAICAFALCTPQWHCMPVPCTTRNALQLHSEERFHPFPKGCLEHRCWGGIGALLFAFEIACFCCAPAYLPVADELMACPIPEPLSTCLLSGREYTMSIASCPDASESSFPSSLTNALNLFSLAFRSSCDAGLKLFSSV